MSLPRSELNQLFDSVLKLLHYTCSFTTEDIDLEFYYGDEHFGGVSFPAPRSVAFSSTLYTRIDDCHGAGNCCRVPFDLVYSDFDVSRIDSYDFGMACKTYGQKSAEQFQYNKATLLSNLERLRIVVNGQRTFYLWVMRNKLINPISGNTSCPFLSMGKDRYWCGIHMFKPLHCWMPHMTVRATETEERDRPAVSIGRNQYGRNHKFGCPVEFLKARVSDSTEPVNADYFKQGGQFRSDCDKLEWLSNCAASMGFTRENNRVVGIHDDLKSVAGTIEFCIRDGLDNNITVWERGVVGLI